MLDARILELVDLAYQAAMEPELWPTVIEGVADAVGGSGGVVLWRGLADRPNGGLAARLDPEALAVYFPRFEAINPIQRGMDRLKAQGVLHGHVVTDENCVARDELLRTETYNDFMRRFDMGGVLLIPGEPIDGGGANTFNVFRTGLADPFGEREVAIGRLLQKPLDRAFRLSSQLAAERRLNQSLESFIDGLAGAIFVVAADGAIFYANPAGETMLAAADGLASSRGVLRANLDAAQRDLAQLIGFATAPDAATRRGGALAVPRPSGRRPLALLVTPARGGLPGPAHGAMALISVVDPEAAVSASEERLRLYFGFTRAEARVAAELAAGHDAKAIAEHLGLALNTARLQIARVREKTGTTRQGEFISLVLRTLGAAWAE